MAQFWPTLGDYVQGLERAGKLIRVTTPVNKDTELHPLVRLQFRGLPEKQRKAFLFENVTDSKGRTYDIPVLIGAMAGSTDIYCLGMNCAVDDISEKWRAAMAKPLPPKPWPMRPPNPRPTRPPPTAPPPPATKFR